MKPRDYQIEIAEKAAEILIRRRFVLDFIGWDNPEYNDVILGKFKKSFFRW